MLGGVDLAAAEAWVRATIEPSGPFELVKQRPWATVLRIPTRQGAVYLKECRPIQGFEPALAAALASRWPDRVGHVLAFSGDRWLLTADAGLPLADLGNPPERWLEILPRYAELQIGEARHVSEHRHGWAGVPDLRLRSVPERWEESIILPRRSNRPLPLPLSEIEAARRLGSRLEALVGRIASAGIPDSIEHADLHARSVFEGPDGLRILDWGDASVGHPFSSIVVTFAVLRDANGLAEDDPWFGRLRGAYLEPWGRGLEDVFEASQRLGAVTRALGWLRHYDAMGTGAFRGFDEQFPDVLRAAIAAIEAT